jgi:hypothetical protein
MNADLIMFSIGMFMAMFFSFLGMLLAYSTYKKHHKGQSKASDDSKE